MGRPAIQLHPEAHAWTRTKEKGAETKQFDVEKRKEVHNVPGKGKPSSYKVTSREPHRSLPETQVPVARAPPTAVNLSSTSLASAAPSHSRERPYVRGLPEGSVVSYSEYSRSTISEAPSQATTRSNLTTSPHIPSVAHSTHSIRAVSVVSDAKSHASTNSVTQSSVPGESHQSSLEAIPIPSRNTMSSRAQSAASTAPKMPPENYLSSPMSRDSSRAPRSTSVAPRHVSEIYPSLPPSRDSSCAAQSMIPENTTPASESRLLTYRAPSVVTAASSTISDQHPLLPAPTASSVIHSLQPSRSPSVASVARDAVSEDRRISPAPVSRSSSIAPSVSVKKESLEYLQESHFRDPSRAPSLQVSSPRALSSRAPSSRTVSVAPSIRSEHVSSTISAARLQADEEYAKSVISCDPSEVRSNARSRRPSVVHRGEEYVAPVPGRDPSIAASTRSTIKSGRSERDSSIASKARSHMDGNDYESNMQLVLSSKRASSIKPGRSERGVSSASKAKTHIDVNDHDSSSKRKPTSRRASSKASSSKISRQPSRDDRGRSTTSRTKGSYDESAGVRISYNEHEEDRPESQSRSVRSRSVSRYRSDSVSSIETVRPGKDNALVAYHDNALHTEASKDATHRRSIRRKRKPDIDVRSYVGSDDVTVVLPDPSEVGEARPASGSQDQQNQQQYRKEYQNWQRREQQYQQRQQYQQQQQYPHPYSQADTQAYPPTYPFQYPQQQQAPYPVHGFPNVQPQYPTPQYAHQSYPDPRYTYPQPTTQPSYPSARYPSQYVTPTPQYGTGYERLGEELEKGRKSGRLPKARDKRREKVERPRRTPRPGGKYEEPPEIYESQYDDGEFPDRWFDN